MKVVQQQQQRAVYHRRWSTADSRPAARVQASGGGVGSASPTTRRGSSAVHSSAISVARSRALQQGNQGLRAQLLEQQRLGGMSVNHAAAGWRLYYNLMRGLCISLPLTAATLDPYADGIGRR